MIEGIAGTFFSQARVDGFDEVMSNTQGWRSSASRSPPTGTARRASRPPRTSCLATAERAGLHLGGLQRDGARRHPRCGPQGRLNDSGGENPPAKGKTSVFTNDVTPESTDAIRDGKLIAETHHGFPEWGWFGTEFAVKLACDQKPQNEDIRPRTV